MKRGVGLHSYWIAQRPPTSAGMRFEQMPMYQAAEALIEEIDALLPHIAPSNPNAADHLKRSGESALFNTAEGIAAWRPKVKLSTYEIARKEANEVRAVLRRVVIQKTVGPEQTRRAYNIASALIAMLISAAKSIEQGKGRDEPAVPPPDATA